jgi:hypothetical protein
MEDIGDILFYIIAAVIGLVTTLGRKKRKDAAKKSTSVPETVDNQQYSADELPETPEIDYQVKEEDFWANDEISGPIEEEVKDPEKVFYSYAEREGSYTEPMAEQFVDEGKSQLDIEEDDPEDELIGELDEGSDLISDFDLEKAVIYSEILARKYY